MSENLSFFEEQPSDMPQIEYIDIISRATWQDFCNQVQDLEEMLAIYDPVDDDDAVVVNNYARELSLSLGEEHLNKQCKVTGLGYQKIDETAAAASEEPLLIDTSCATYHGVNICHLNGRWQVTLEIYCHEHTEDVPYGIYNIPTDKYHLLTMNINADDSDIEDENDDVDIDLIQSLHNDYNNVQTFVYGIQFASATPDEQRKVLDDIIMGADGDMPRVCRDREVVIECTNYYTAYDDMHYASYEDPRPGFDLRDFLTDQSDLPVDERRELKGTIVGFAFPELSTLPKDHPLSGGVLDMNNGSYCLVLRSENTSDNATYYIQPQTISIIY